MRLWRNWQTRYLQAVVSTTCGFESHQPHQTDWAIAKWLRHRTLTPRPRVRISLALPAKIKTEKANGFSVFFLSYNYVFIGKAKKILPYRWGQDISSLFRENSYRRIKGCKYSVFGK